MGTPASNISTANVSRNMWGKHRFADLVALFQHGQLEEMTEAPLPIGDSSLRQAVPAPKEIARIWLGSRRDCSQIPPLLEEEAERKLFRVLIIRNLLILGSGTTAKKAPLPDPLYVYCTKIFFAFRLVKACHKRVSHRFRFLRR